MVQLRKAYRLYCLKWFHVLCQHMQADRQQLIQNQLNETQVFQIQATH